MANKPKTVLLVDDDPDVIDTLRAILERAGYDVVAARSGEEGLGAYDGASPDVVIVDLMMEEVDSGTALVKELALRPHRAPVYMLSSVGDALLETIDYARLGLAGVLQKPVDPADLVELLRSRLGD